MLKNYILTAWRSLKRNKLQTGINILGLAIGIAGCLTVFLLTKYELAFNKEIIDSDRIYRVCTHFNGEYGGGNPGVPTGLINLAPEVLQSTDVQCRMHTFTSKVTVPNEQNPTALKKFKRQKDLVLTTPDYFDLIQNYEWITGSPRQSLSKPNQVVLTESRAKLYFGLKESFEAVGRELIYSDSLRMIVTGIVKDPDFQSDFFFNDFISAKTIQGTFLEDYHPINNWYSTSSSNQFWIKTSSGIAAVDFEKELAPLNERFNAENDPDDPINEFKLQPLADLHFDPNLGAFDYSRPPAPKKTLYGLMLIAGLLLLIAAVNFINLATVQATRRAKETGVRKIIGASKSHLTAQFLTETALIALLALPVATALSELSLQYFSEFLPPELTINILSPGIILFLFCTVLAVTFLAGLYPSFVMSSFKPASALKTTGGNFLGKRSSGLRKGLIVFQFVLAQAFIIGALIMGEQLNYVLHQDLGFNEDAVVYFYTPWRGEASKRAVFQQKLNQLAEVSATSLQNKPPIDLGYNTNVVEFSKDGEKKEAQVHTRSVDTAYLNLYGIELLAGRNFNPSDTIREFVINETFAKKMGYTNPSDAVGTTLDWRNGELPIVGVAKDFHLRSFHHQIEPLVMYSTKKGGATVSAKVTKSQPLTASLDKFEGIWKEIYPDSEFNYHVLNETVEKLYKTEAQTAKLINTATGLAILISCLGLFGLAFFTVTQRAKEISIRKVLGATVTSVVGLLSKDFLKLVFIALLIASPIAYYFMDTWLQDFVYRIDIQWWMFVLAGIAAILISFVTVGFQSMKAALANPVDSLKNE
ncbi:MAG: ABC transporter permease [Bacteroidetes bacterium]|jgi:putative ABC transport system permease protein|nr:ABC transporter permease [Bacteroidota bacterium]